MENKRINKINIKQALLQEHSRKQMLQIVDFIGNSPARFKQLVNIFLEGDYRLTQRASWPLTYCAEKYPHFFTGYIPRFLDQFNTQAHNAVRRNIVRMLQFVDIPQADSGRAMNICFDLVMNPKEPVANKAFALTVLSKLAKKYPEIKNEILLCIETQLPHSSPGFRARARKVRRELENKNP